MFVDCLEAVTSRIFVPEIENKKIGQQCVNTNSWTITPIPLLNFDKMYFCYSKLNDLKG